MDTRMGVASCVLVLLQCILLKRADYRLLQYLRENVFLKSWLKSTLFLDISALIFSIFGNFPELYFQLLPFQLGTYYEPYQLPPLLTSLLPVLSFAFDIIQFMETEAGTSTTQVQRSKAPKRSTGINLSSRVPINTTTQELRGFYPMAPPKSLV